METATKTYRQIWADKGTVVINGNTWTASDMTIDRKTVILTRFVRVKAHFRRLSNYQASGFRFVEIRRPADAIAR